MSCVQNEHAFSMPHLVVVGADGGGYLRHPSPVPEWMNRAYGAILNAAERLGLEEAPTLILAQDVGGHGALYLPVGQIVVGWEDVCALAERVRLILIQQQNEFVPINQLRALAVGRLLAHEVGHALSYTGVESPYDHHAEAAADYWAGVVDGMRRFPIPHIGQWIFASIGCLGPACAHPSPVDRATIYAEGHAVGQQLRLQ
jgi:hypothetical protein